jgi:hypothetical protein
MSNTGATLAKVVMLAGGAVIGALLARWLDDLLEAQGDEQYRQAEYDRNRYSQGLAAKPLEPQGPPQTPFQVTPEETQQKEQFE